MNIENLSWKGPEIQKEFRQQVDDMISDVKASTQTKICGGQKLNGQMLLGLAMDFCEAVSSDQVPKIQNSVARLVQEEITQAE